MSRRRNLVNYLGTHVSFVLLFYIGKINKSTLILFDLLTEKFQRRGEFSRYSLFPDILYFQNIKLVFKREELKKILLVLISLVKVESRTELSIEKRVLKKINISCENCILLKNSK